MIEEHTSLSGEELGEGVSTRQVPATGRSASADRLSIRRFIDGSIAFALADGAGGSSGGSRAAALVIESFELWLASSSTAATRSSDYAGLLAQIDATISDDREAGETTAVLGLLQHDVLVGASVGDSEAWVIGDAHVSVVTDPRAARPRLGLGTARPSTFDVGVPETSVVLVASDGLFRAARPEAICDLIRACKGDARAEGLLALARGRSGRFYDDVSFLLLDAAAQRQRRAV